MRIEKRTVGLPLAVIGVVLGFAAGPAASEEAFKSWGAVPAQELSEQRGMAFELDESELAVAVGAQHQNVIINGAGVGDAGVINMGTHTFDGQVMSLNIINSGHNNVFQAQNVIAVTVSGGLP